MSSQFIVPSLIGLTVLIAATFCSLNSQRLKKPVRIVAALVFAATLLFCVFGFAAAMEPGDDHLIWRWGYAFGFLASLISLARLVFAKPTEVGSAVRTD